MYLLGIKFLLHYTSSQASADLPFEVRRNEGSLTQCMDRKSYSEIVKDSALCLEFWVILPPLAPPVNQEVGGLIHRLLSQKCADHTYPLQEAPNHGRFCVPTVCQLSHTGRTREILIRRITSHKC